MEILVDDRPFQSQGDAGQSIQELANEVCDTLDEGGSRMVVALRCDSSDVPSDALDVVLGLPASQFERIELQTQPIQALLRQTLAQARQIFEEATEPRHHIADLLEEGKHSEAMEPLQTMFASWKQIQDTVIVTARTLNADMDHLEVGGVRLLDMVETMRDMLNELVSGIRNQDFVLVGDVLRYELDEPLQHWFGVLDELADRVASLAA